MAASEENVRRKTNPAPPPFGPKTKGPRPLSAPPSALLKEVAQNEEPEVIEFKKHESAVDEIDDEDVFRNEDHETSSGWQSSDADLTEDENMTGDNPHRSTYVLPETQRTERRKSSVNTTWEPGVVCKGEFLKKSHYRGEWRKRYFVLMKSNDIRYFKDDLEREELGCLSISEETQFIVEETIDLDMVCNDRTWHLRFYTTESRDFWKEKLEATKINTESMGSLKLSGYLNKLGSPIPLWKIKYVKLYANMTVKFFNHHGDSMVNGVGTFSPLQKITEIDREHKDDLNWPYEFNLETDGGTWKFRSRTEDQLKLWMDCISSTWENWSQLTPVLKNASSN